jgi:hypothetical protein
MAILNTHCKNNVAVTVASELCLLYGSNLTQQHCHFRKKNIPLHFYWTYIFTYQISFGVYLIQMTILV